MLVDPQSNVRVVGCRGRCALSVRALLMHGDGECSLRRKRHDINLYEGCRSFDCPLIAQIMIARFVLSNLLQSHR